MRMIAFQGIYESKLLGKNDIMVSLTGNLTQTEKARNSRSSQSQANRVPVMDTEQMFRLIDSILPFEACLYYQILPLSLAGSTIELGMVDINDTAALDYARRILSYMNCSLKPQSITSQYHHSMLSAYLSKSGKSSSPKQKRSGNTDATERPTLIVKGDEFLETAAPSPTSLETQKNDRVEPADAKAQATKTTHLPEPVVSPEKQSNPPKSSPTDREVGAEKRETNLPPANPTIGSNAPATKEQSRQSSHEALKKLSPQQLLTELLGRVIVDGIGRLYFERQSERVRILCSQNGILHSVVEGISKEQFQGAIDELKQMVQLPLTPVEQPQQVEIERRYQQERILLRLRVMPSQYGEQATLQVLRGEALTFYQQQQVSRLSKDALGLTQQLEKKLGQIRDRVRPINPPLNDAQEALDRLRQNLDQHINALDKTQGQKPTDKQND